MISPPEIALIVAVSSIVILLIIIILALTYSSPKKVVERPRKASLPPLGWGYKPLPSEGGRGHQETPPRPPEGPGGGSH